jgi:ATPase
MFTNWCAQIESGNIRNYEIIIPQAVIDELQSQASQKKDQGFAGLKEIKNLKDLSKNFGLEISIQGNHPTSEDIRMAGKGKIDSIIKDIAKQNQATNRFYYQRYCKAKSSNSLYF